MRLVAAGSVFAVFIVILFYGHAGQRFAKKAAPEPIPRLVAWASGPLNTEDWSLRPSTQPARAAEIAGLSFAAVVPAHTWSMRLASRGVVAKWAGAISPEGYYESVKAEEALRELYVGGVYDLTVECFAAALSELRRRDPLRAQAVERALEPWLRERGIFPRRRVAWHETSQGLRARIALLPGNPHLELDVRAVRDALGIPSDQLRATADSELSVSLEEFLATGGHASAEETRYLLRTVMFASTQGRWETAAEAADRNLANQWLWCHRAAAFGVAIDVERECPDLPAAAVSSAQASRKRDLSTTSEPEWLSPEPPDTLPMLNTSVPIDRTVALLIERHRLPAVSWVAEGLKLYVVTR